MVDLTDGEIADKIASLYDLRPAAIEKQLKLRNPIYLETASYGHMGRTPRTITKTFTPSTLMTGYHRSGTFYLGKTGLRGFNFLKHISSAKAGILYIALFHYFNPIFMFSGIVEEAATVVSIW